LGDNNPWAGTISTGKSSREQAVVLAERVVYIKRRVTCGGLQPGKNPGKSVFKRNWQGVHQTMPEK